LSVDGLIIATERAKRPVAPKPEPQSGEGGYCPFCEGQEDKTPHEIIAYRDRNTRPNERGWRVRVVPNKFRRSKWKAISTSAATGFTTR